MTLPSTRSYVIVRAPGPCQERNSHVQPEHSSTGPSGPSKHEFAYRRIRQRILDGRYQPGHRLVLSTLARELDVSPVPVREAIRSAGGRREPVSFEGRRPASTGEDAGLALNYTTPTRFPPVGTSAGGSSRVPAGAFGLRSPCGRVGSLAAISTSMRLVSCRSAA